MHQSQDSQHKAFGNTWFHSFTFTFCPNSLTHTSQWSIHFVVVVVVVEGFTTHRDSHTHIERERERERESFSDDLALRASYSGEKNDGPKFRGLASNWLDCGSESEEEW